MVLVHLLVVSILLYHLLAVLYVQVHQVRLLVTLIGLKIHAGQTNTNSLQSRLNALTNIASSASDTGSLGVVVTRSNINNATNEGYVFSVTFSGSYVAGNVSLLTLQNNSLGGQNTSDGAITVIIE